MKFKNKMVNNVSNKIKDTHGEPHLIEYNRKTNNLTKVTWLNIEGCDGVIVKGDVKYKWHPLPAVTFVFAYKFMDVPEHLQGPLMYASETIIVDYIDIPATHSKQYYKDGTKSIAKVSGACASITISVITIKFVEDMIRKYKNKFNMKLDNIFRKEYDKRILNFLCGGGIKPQINWYPNITEKKDVNGPFVNGNKPDVCNNL